MTELTHRAASLRDLKEIWELFRQTALDVPFNPGEQAGREKLLTEIMCCCTAGLAPIALAQGKSIIGALLVRRDDFQWGCRNSGALHISYAAIAAGHRDQNVLATLIAKIQERKVPVFASVKTGDQLGFVAALTRAGFVYECTAADDWGELYKWQPQGERLVH
jgi:hypothetical protein